jgi:hypothetical protein
MLEELGALEKNKTWDLVKFPIGKKVVSTWDLVELSIAKKVVLLSCKWVFTMKQTPEGKVERYKARLVVRGYSQTYGDETFAPVAKMSTVKNANILCGEFWMATTSVRCQKCFLAWRSTGRSIYGARFHQVGPSLKQLGGCAN